jgi:hypothetical protein
LRSAAFGWGRNRQLELGWIFREILYIKCIRKLLHLQ